MRSGHATAAVRPAERACSGRRLDRAVLTEPLPDSVRRMLVREGLDGRPILLSTSTDIGLQGGLERQWLVITPDDVSVSVDGDTPRLLGRWALPKVSRFRTYGVVGSGFLQAQIDDLWVDLLRF